MSSHALQVLVLILAWAPPAGAGPFEWQRPGRSGTNALYVLAKLSGSSVTHASVANELPSPPPEGHSAAELQAAAERLGVPVVIRQVEPDQIGSLPIPFILQLTASDGGEGPFLTVFQLDRERGGIYYIDGASGLQSMKAAGEYAPLFSGTVILPAETASEWPTWQWVGSGVAVCAIGQVVLLWIVRRRN